MFTCAAALALSAHLFAGDYQSVHPSIRCDRDGWNVGAFLNSEDRISLTAGRTFKSGPWWAEVGAATGYEYAKVVPFARFGRILSEGYHVFVLPTLKPDSHSVGFVVGFEYRF